MAATQSYWYLFLLTSYCVNCEITRKIPHVPAVNGVDLHYRQSCRDRAGNVAVRPVFLQSYSSFSLEVSDSSPLDGGKGSLHCWKYQL